MVKDNKDNSSENKIELEIPLIEPDWEKIDRKELEEWISDFNNIGKIGLDIAKKISNVWKSEPEILQYLV